MKFDESLIVELFESGKKGKPIPMFDMEVDQSTKRKEIKEPLHCKHALPIVKKSTAKYLGCLSLERDLSRLKILQFSKYVIMQID